MASWVTADLSKLLPDGIEEIFDTISGLVSVVSVPLDFSSAALNVAKAFITSLPTLSLTAALADLIAAFKADLLASGLYICNMWDYPQRQIALGPGPGETYGTFETSGTVFETSFLADLDASFNDENDPLRPQFQGNVAMLVLVIGRPSLEELGLTMEEDNIADGFGGLSSQIGASCAGLQEMRWQGAWSKMKGAAAVQPEDRVFGRTERVQNAFKLYCQMPQDERDGVPIPLNPESGEAFFEDVTVQEIDWEEGILPILEAVEDMYDSPAYPDWNRVALVDVYPELIDIVDTIFDPVLQLLTDGATFSDTIIGMIDAIQAKLDELQAIIDRIDAILLELESLFNMTGFSALFVQSSNGVDDLRDKLTNATNVPFDGERGFFGGMAILAGTTNAALFTALFGPLGS